MTRFGLIPVLLLCACGQPADQAAPRETTAEAKAAPDKAPAAGLPDYLPPYPGSVPVEVPNLGVPGTDSRSGNASARETGATPDEVARFYRARFAEAGVPVRADTIDANGGLLSVGRDGETGAMLTITRRDGRTRITVIRRGGGR